ARVAAHARRTAVDREAAETADLDAVAARERIGHRIEDRLDRELGVALRQLAEALGQPGHEVRSGHRSFGRPSVLLAVVELGTQQGAQAGRAGRLALVA